MPRHLKIAILLFPGTNCEQDLEKVLSKYYKANIILIWHRESFNDEYDIYFLPGGFSYGDYLRGGALAKMSPVISSLKHVIQRGKIVVGICNGFQILTEAHFLPGVLLRNQNLKHICQWVELKNHTELTKTWKMNEKIYLPISHSEGNFFCSDEELYEIHKNQQIFFQYKENPNGSIDNIAGISNQNKNVFGLMPHPERAFMASSDLPHSKYQYGKVFFDWIFSMI